MADLRFAWAVSFRGRLRTAANEFGRGATQPSSPALASALVTCLGLTLTIVLVVTPDFMITHGDRLWATDSFDYDLQATTRALVLARHSPDRPAVVIIGASTIRASILEGPLRRELESLTPAGPEVFKLCTGRQSLWESVALLEMVPNGTQGTVVFGIGPGLVMADPPEFTERSTGERLGFRSETIDRALAAAGRRPPPRTGIYAIDNAQFLLARYDVPFRRRGEAPETVESRFLGQTPVSNELWADWGRRVNERFGQQSEENADANLAQIRQCLAQLQARTDMTVLLVESPVNPRFLREFDRGDLFERFRGRFRRLAAESGARFVELNSEAALDEIHFHDWAHLCAPDAIGRCTRLVAERIVESQPALRSTRRPATRHAGAPHDRSAVEATR